MTMTSLDEQVPATDARESTTWWLRAEGLAAFAVALVAYQWVGQGWWLFAGLFLAPDLFMAGYGLGPRVGAAIYNLGHVYTVPAALGAVALAGGPAWLIPIALIWTAHIGFDRMLGYGLKRDQGFRHTHLGDV